MRAAFVITSHADVDQLERLVRTIQREPGVGVYISHDIAGEPGVERLAGDRCRVIRERGGRGDFTQIERILSLFARVEADGGAEFVTVLSGQDYPARPLSEFIEASRSAGDGMLHHFRALDPSGDWSMHESKQRYLFRWRILWPISTEARRRWRWLHAINYAQPLVRVNVSYGTFRVGRYRGRLPQGITCFGGSAWFTLGRRAVQHVLSVAAGRPDIMEWARTSLAVDEVFFQSILVSHGDFTFVNDNGRFIDFDGDGFGHPRILVETDHERIVEAGAYFVRKVDSVRSSGLLDLLDASIAR